VIQHKTSKREHAAKEARLGRPPAKHSSADYAQMCLYISKDVRTLVKVELLAENGEFSGLVESLLRAWLRKRGIAVSETGGKGDRPATRSGRTGGAARASK
jgi:hypothetical protein